MTVEQIIRQGQALHPLDLVARVAWLDMKADTCDADDLGAYLDALDRTRNGFERKP